GEARVLEIEAPVLVVRAARDAAHVHLIAVVLPGALVDEPELERVAAAYPGHVIRVVINRAAGAGRVWSVVELRESVDVDSRHLVGDVLRGRAVQVGIIDPIL